MPRGLLICPIQNIPLMDQTGDRFAEDYYRDLQETIHKATHPAAGLEEIQAVLDRLVKDPAVQGSLQERGWISLEPGQIGAFGYQTVGGFIVVDSAKMTDAGHAVIADENLSNDLAERALAWLRVGKGAPEVVRNAKLLNARKGDLILLKAESGLTPEEVKRLLAENGIEGAEGVRAVIGDNVQVKNLSVFAFQLLAGGYPESS